MNNTNKRLLTLMKHHSDSQKTLDNELDGEGNVIKHHVGVLLLRQQLSKAKWGTNERRWHSVYSYSASFWHYYSTEYEYAIQPTIRVE